MLNILSDRKDIAIVLILKLTHLVVIMMSLSLIKSYI